MKRKTINQVLCVALAAVTLGLTSWQYADACSRILWNDNKLAVVVARTMDWPESTEPVLTVFPRGAERHGGMVGPQIVMAKARGARTSVHLALDDAGGESAIVECIGGERVGRRACCA